MLLGVPANALPTFVQLAIPLVFEKTYLVPSKGS